MFEVRCFHLGKREGLFPGRPHRAAGLGLAEGRAPSGMAGFELAQALPRMLRLPGKA